MGYGLHQTDLVDKIVILCFLHMKYVYALVVQNDNRCTFLVKLKIITLIKKLSYKMFLAEKTARVFYLW